MKQGTSILPPNIVAAIPKLTHSALKLAVAIGKYADKQGVCWPATRTLMKDAGITDWRTFQAARKSLKPYGLTWETGKGRRSCRYQLTNVAPVTTTDTMQDIVPVTITDVVPVTITGGTPHRTPQRSTIKIDFDRARGVFTGITDTTFERWAKTYQLVDVEHEIGAAAEWLLANPTKQKKNYQRFLTNWLKNAQDRTTQKSGGKSPEPVQYSEEWWDQQEPHLQDTFDKKHKIGTYAEVTG